MLWPSQRCLTKNGSTAYFLCSLAVVLHLWWVTVSKQSNEREVIDEEETSKCLVVQDGPGSRRRVLGSIPLFKRGD